MHAIVTRANAQLRRFRPIVLVCYLAVLGMAAVASASLYMGLRVSPLACVVSLATIFGVYTLNRFTDMKEDFANDSYKSIFFTRHRHLDPAEDGGMMAEWWGDLLIEGSPDAELIPELRPQEGELLIEKSRYSAFLNTPLEHELRQRRVTDVIVGGVMTNLCCETTARDAFMRDFRVFFLLDGIWFILLAGDVALDMYRGVHSWWWTIFVVLLLLGAKGAFSDYKRFAPVPGQPYAGGAVDGQT